jgi:M3 family oligoendopeptidase
MTTPGFAKDYQRPDLADVAARTRAFADQCNTAATGDGLLDVVTRWNDLRSHVDTHYNVAMVRYEQNTADDAAKAEQDFWDEAAPVMRELDVIFARALLAAPHRDALVNRFGAQLIAMKQCTATTFAPEIKDALAQEAKLTSAYQQMMSRPEVQFRGESMSMSGIAGYFIDADRATRLEAQQARDAFLGARGDELDDMYDRLVHLRDDMGRALGHDSYTPLGYQLMTRSDYGPDEVAVFRDALVREIVPLAHDLHRVQARRLGVEPLLLHDEPVWDLAGNPRPRGDAAYIVEHARTMYRELHPRVGEFFDMMVERELLDLELRDGKAGGGFCTHFADQGVPFVFANFNGSDHDIAVVTHECGHAFQSYSARDQPLLEFAFPTCEAAEVHSMSMEFLTYPWMHLFFGDDAERYKRIHVENSVAFLPYIAAVDHFQHEVYARPSLSPAERNALWLDMEARYLPHRDYGGLFPYLQTGTIWQRQQHIYQRPFYYIDYALAQVCAMQLWLRATQDRDAALRDYFAICEVGGSVSFTEMLEVGNLRSPFDPEVLRDVAAHARAAVLPD